MGKPDPKVVYNLAVQMQLSELVAAVQVAKKDEAILVLTGAAFANDYSQSELYLFGAALKYATDNGVTVHVIPQK